MRAAAVERACDELKAEAVPVETVLSAGVDVVAPCAHAAVLNEHSIPALRASIVAGGANNQLAQDRPGLILHVAGILYAPDYIINAGGIISAMREHLGGSTEAQVTGEL